MIAARSSSLAFLLCSATLFLVVAGCTPDPDPGEYTLLNVAYADVQKDASCYANGEVPDSIKDDTTSFRAGGTLVLFRGPEDLYFLQTETVVLEGARDAETFTFEGESVDVEYVNSSPGVTILDADHDGLNDDINDAMVDADKDGLNDLAQDDEVDTDNDGLDDRYQDDEVDVDKDGLDDRYAVIEPPTEGDKLTKTTRSSVSFTISGGDLTGSSETSTETTCSGATCPTEVPSCKTSVTFVGTVVEDARVEHQI